MTTVPKIPQRDDEFVILARILMARAEAHDTLLTAVVAIFANALSPGQVKPFFDSLHELAAAHHELDIEGLEDADETDRTAGALLAQMANDHLCALIERAAVVQKVCGDAQT
jgi:hypothetical protein